MVRELIIDPELEKCLPPLPEVQFQKLRASIEKKYDPAKPIVLWKERPNTIVDGHHRYRICQELGKEPVTIEESFVSLDDALLYTLQRQVEQRNLSAGQVISVIEQMMSIEDRQKLERDAKRQQGTRTDLSDSTSDKLPTQEVAKKIAEKAGTSERTVYKYHAVQNKGVPELLEMVQSGDLSVEHAEKVAQSVPKEKQSDIIKSGGVSAVRDAAKEIRAERAAKAASQKEAEELQKFNEFNKTVARETAIAHAKIDQAFRGANGGCLMPNVAELWCSDCRWGFDVFLPMPSSKSSCPYCKGENITKRDTEWNPRFTNKEL